MEMFIAFSKYIVNEFGAQGSCDRSPNIEDNASRMWWSDVLRDVKALKFWTPENWCLSQIFWKVICIEEETTKSDGKERQPTKSEYQKM